MFQKLKEYRKYLLPFLIAVFVMALFFDSAKTLAMVGAVFGTIGYLTTRFVTGFAIAYGLGFIVSFFRKRLKMPGALAIFLSYLALFGFIALMLTFIIPMVADSLRQIINLIGAMPAFYVQAQAWLETFFIELDEDLVTQIIEFGQGALQNLLGSLNKLLDFAMWEGILRGSTRIVINLMFALILSIYVLAEQENVGKTAKRLLYAALPIRKARGVIEFVRESNRVFSQFLIGKLLDSLIIGLLSAIAFIIFQIPQAGFFAILVGVTNVIPYFGPLVGGAVSVLILLFFSVPSALTALVIIVVLQAFDGWYLGPKILGNAVGTSPLLTIAAISLGGDLAGFMGIFLGVPAMAVFKTMVYDRYIIKLLRRRRAQAEDSRDEEAAAELAVLENMETEPTVKPERQKKPRQKRKRKR